MLETVDRITSSVTECAYDVTLHFYTFGIVVRNNVSLQLSPGTEIANVLNYIPSSHIVYLNATDLLFMVLSTAGKI